MKKILVFIDWYVPGYKAGGPIRSMANIVDHLKDKYEFLIVTRNTDYLESKPYDNITPDSWMNLSENQKVIYLSDKNITARKIKQIIRNTEFDLAYINGVYSFYFSVLPLILLRYFSRKKAIVAPRGMFSAQGLGVKSLKKKAFVMFCRLVRAYRKSIIHVTSSAEYSDIQRLNLKPIQLFQVTNLPPAASPVKEMGTGKTPRELKLVSIARISPEKNTLFALQCLKNYPFKGIIQFDLFGSIYNKSYWEKCKDVIDSLPENISVNYRGELDNSMVTSTLSNYHFLFLPSMGENFGHSILESFLAGCPVIISTKTPWQNIENENVGWGIDLDKPELFAEKIQLAMDLEAGDYSSMSESSRNYAIAKTNLEETKLAYCKLFG
ncbi:MAG: glycosyltransferase [Chloroflexia bacterium]|nr:glycosyltransferase [Chloroflexia bacterium]